MRHRKKFNHLGRKKGHRKAMLANMACSLIEHKRINTTLAKAKALKKFVEPLITKSKSDTTHNRRIVFSRRTRSSQPPSKLTFSRKASRMPPSSGTTEDCSGFGMMRT